MSIVRTESVHRFMPASSPDADLKPTGSLSGKSAQPSARSGSPGDMKFIPRVLIEDVSAVGEQGRIFAPR